MVSMTYSEIPCKLHFIVINSQKNITIEREIMDSKILILENANKVRNLVKSIGPRLISQSDSASESYKRHQSRLASVEVATELVRQEIAIYAKVKEQLLQRYIDADEVERIRIKRDLEEIESNVRHLNIVGMAIDHLPASQNQVSQIAESPENPSLEQKEVSPHWLDKFRELSRARNEDWRENLLSLALAEESSRPGTVSPRALWLLGTLEEPMFVAFATILDLCASIGNRPMIPNSAPLLAQNLTQKPVPNCNLGDNVPIGSLVYLLGSIGVLAELTVQCTFPQGSKFSASYHSNKCYVVECLSQSLTVGGTILTPLGESIASFHPSNFNPLGEEIFKAWVDSLDRNQFLVTEVNSTETTTD